MEGGGETPIRGRKQWRDRAKEGHRHGHNGLTRTSRTCHIDPFPQPNPPPTPPPPPPSPTHPPSPPFCRDYCFSPHFLTVIAGGGGGGGEGGGRSFQFHLLECHSGQIKIASLSYIRSGQLDQKKKTNKQTPNKPHNKQTTQKQQ